MIYKLWEIHNLLIIDTVTVYMNALMIRFDYCIFLKD